MRRLTRPAAVVAAAIITSGLISLASSLPASADTTGNITVSSGTCTEQGTTNMYKSGQTGYEVVKVTMTSSCGLGIEAGISCNGGKDGRANIWGTEIYNAGDESFASCNTDYPAFDGNGGFRIWINGAWQYHTDIYT